MSARSWKPEVDESILGLPHRDGARRKLQSDVPHSLSMFDAPTICCSDEPIDVTKCARGSGATLGRVIDVLMDGQAVGLDCRSVASDDAFMVAHEVLRVVVERTHCRIDEGGDLGDRGCRRHGQQIAVVDQGVGHEAVDQRGEVPSIGAHKISGDHVADLLTIEKRLEVLVHGAKVAPECSGADALQGRTLYYQQICKARSEGLEPPTF
jgi:hypothetical protein